MKTCRLIAVAIFSFGLGVAVTWPQRVAASMPAASSPADALQAPATAGTHAALAASGRTSPAEPSASGPVGARALETDPAMATLVRFAALNAMTGEALAQRQLQLERIRCEASSCALNLRVPPQAPQARDPSAAADLMQALRDRTELKDWTVALSRVAQQPEGMVIDLEIAPPGTGAKHLLSDADIARIRGETLQAYIASQEGKKP